MQQNKILGFIAVWVATSAVLGALTSCSNTLPTSPRVKHASPSASIPLPPSAPTPSNSSPRSDQPKYRLKSSITSTSAPYPRSPISSSKSSIDGELYARLEAEARRDEQRQAAYEKLLKNAVDKLPKGEFFHTVPKTMTADVPVVIEAGITNKITTQVLEDLQIRGTPEIKKDIPYDPLGVEVKLDIDKDAFKVRDIKTGVKPIIPGFPESWMWEIVPTRKGKSTIAILVIVQLKAPGLGKDFKRETVVFKEERDVQVNLGYSTSKFLESNWKEASALLVGSGSLSWFLKYLLDRRNNKQDTLSKKTQSSPAVAHSSNQEANGRTE